MSVSLVHEFFSIFSGRSFSLLCSLLFFCSVSLAQEPSRRTALGTPSLSPLDRLLNEASKQDSPPATVLEPLSQLFERAATAHGGRQALREIAAIQAEGVFTIYESDGAVRTYPTTVMVKGDASVQRIITQSGGVQLKQGSDGGRTWDSMAGHSPRSQGSGLSFIELQTVRSVRALFDFASRGARARDGGLRGPNRMVDVEEANGRATTYTFEPSGIVVRVEFVSGMAGNILSGKLAPVTERYEFSDYQTIQGIRTPLKVTHYSNGIRVDETRFASVRFNQSLPGDVFRP